MEEKGRCHAHVQRWFPRDGLRHHACRQYPDRKFPGRASSSHSPNKSTPADHLAFHREQLGDIDPAQSGYWSVRESFVSFVLTNLPAVYPLIKNFVDKTRLTYGSRSASNMTGGKDKSGGLGYRLNSYPKGSRYAKNKGANSSATPNMRQPWDSEEKIVDAAKSPSIVVMGAQDDRPSLDDIGIHGNFAPESVGNSSTSHVIAPGRRNRASQQVSREQAPGGILVTKAYEFRVSEAPR